MRDLTQVHWKASILPIKFFISEKLVLLTHLPYIHYLTSPVQVFQLFPDSFCYQVMSIFLFSFFMVILSGVLELCMDQHLRQCSMILLEILKPSYSLKLLHFCKWTKPAPFQMLSTYSLLTSTGEVLGLGLPPKPQTHYTTIFKRASLKVKRSRCITYYQLHA